jgi:thioredoxin reductase (NADPH)
MQEVCQCRRVLTFPQSTYLQEAAKAETKPKEEQVAVAAEDVNLQETRHQGQVALRRLYHESKRPLVVMYTSPGCGA